MFKIAIGRLAHFWVKKNFLQNLICFLNEDGFTKACVILKTFKYLLYENGFLEVENSEKYYDLNYLKRRNIYLIKNPSIQPNSIKTSLIYMLALRVNLQTETMLWVDLWDFWIHRNRQDDRRSSPFHLAGSSWPDCITFYLPTFSKDTRIHFL